ncbi:hypothetical protein PFISCL1PPCAC_24691, partial [Pristionchus fissidentatus]
IFQFLSSTSLSQQKDFDPTVHDLMSCCSHLLPLVISTVPCVHLPAHHGAVPYHEQCSLKSALMTSSSQLYDFSPTKTDYPNSLCKPPCNTATFLVPLGHLENPQFGASPCQVQP